MVGGAFFGGARALGLVIVGGVVWSLTFCSAAAARLAGCSVTCACCLLTGLPAVVCCCALLSTDSSSVLGLVWSSLAPQVDFPPEPSRAPPHGSCIRDYDSPRWCRVLWRREPSPVRCWSLDPVLRVGLFGGLGLARWAPSPTISGQFGRARPRGAELGGL